MSKHEAELVISCKSTGTKTVSEFNTEVLRANKSSAKLKSTIAGIFSTGALLKYGKESIKLFQIQEAAVEGLRSALLKQGIAYQSVTSDLMKFSSEMQSQTVHGDEQIAMVMSQGLNMGITADKIKEATEAAIGLSAAYNMQLGSAMMLIARASQGQTQMLTRYGIVLDKNLKPQEKYAALLKLGAGNMQIAADKTKTLTGSLQQTGNLVNDAKEVVGKQFAPAIINVSESVRGLTQGFLNLNPETQRFIVITGTLTSGMIALKTATNLKALADGVAAKAGLGHVGSMEKMEEEATASAKSLKTFANYSAELKQKEVDRAAIVEKVNLAQKAQTDGLEQLAKADERVAILHGKVAEAERAYRETGADWLRNLDNKEDYEEFRYRAKELSNLKEQMSSAEKEVLRLESAYADVNDNLRTANKELELFDTARKKELDYTKNLEENVAAQRAREEVLSKTGSATKADQAAVAAHNQVLQKNAIAAKQAETAEYLRARALSMGATEAQADAVAQEYRNKVMAQSAKSPGVIARGLKGMAVGFKSAAVAAKGLMVSMLPMLALSAAIAGIDYLINRRANANKAAAEIAEKELETAKQLVAKGNEQRKNDQEKLARYQELAKYSDRSAEEQKELVTLANELNHQYEGMNVPLLKQNDILSDTAGLWDKIKKKQHEAYIENMRHQFEVQKRELQTAALRTADEIHATWSWDKYNASIREEMFNEIAKRNINNQIPELLQLRKIFVDRKDADRVEAIDSYIQKVKNLIAFQNDIRKAYGSGSTGVGNLNPEEEDKKLNEALRKERKSVEEEKWQMAFRKADRDGQLKMLEQKRKDYQQELSLIHARTKDVKEIERRAQLQKEILGIEEQIGDINRETSQKVLDTLTQQRDSQAGVWEELLNAGRQYKETAQSAIASNSEQAIRMQSRVLFTPKINFAEQAQKTTAITTENILKVIEDWKRENDTLKNNVQSIADKLGLTTY